ncbi:DNA ligase [Thalassolituus sp. LLYu03]|uniref:DNA ligase n=1 Tax=Thalassolituus sp. LLYu03 TaxID=3421656 RepID=UPI003D2D59C6
MDLIVMALLVLALLWPHWSQATTQAAPALMLAKTYQQGVDVTQYFVSEKLDGIRAYWDGHRLLTRSGRVIPAPAWFLTALPNTPLDGELWSGRGQFGWISGVLNRKTQRDVDWQKIRYMVFDLPQLTTPFTERLWVLRTLVAQQGNPQLKALEQFRVSSDAELQQKLSSIAAEGGEGVMLHRATSLYQARRSNDLLKYKITDDDEAEVVGYVPGEGKYHGLLGALLVRMDDGREFRLGTGFSDEERANPPALGTQVTFAYNGLTEHGLPRFARFIRIRPLE